MISYKKKYDFLYIFMIDETDLEINKHYFSTARKRMCWVDPILLD